MKTKLISAALVLVLLGLAPLSVASAKDSVEGVSVPVSGTFTDAGGGTGRFAGTLTILRFAVVSDTIHAMGTITGSLTDSQGNVVATGLQTLSIPVTVGTAAPVAADQKQTHRPVTFNKASFNHASKAASAPAAQLSCQILRLSIGAVDLNLLGLVVHLNPVLLIITAVPGPGNLLGNLLCAIVNLLNSGGPLSALVTLLNQLLALLGG